MPTTGHHALCSYTAAAPYACRCTFIIQIEEHFAATYPIEEIKEHLAQSVVTEKYVRHVVANEILAIRDRMLPQGMYSGPASWNAFTTAIDTAFGSSREE